MLPLMTSRKHNSWFWLLLLPFAGLCFPQMYNRETPYLFGVPFFYWYQFVWVIVATAILGVVYVRTREDVQD